MNNANYEYRFTSLKNGEGEFFNAYIDYPIENGQYNLKNKQSVELLIKISPSKGEVFYLDYVSTYPIPPILTFPFNIDGTIEIYFKHFDNNGYDYFYKKGYLYNSTTTGFSFFIPSKRTNFMPMFTQSHEVGYYTSIDKEPYYYRKGESVPEGWEYRTQYVFDKELNLKNNSPYYSSHQYSIVKVSEAENPLVFPVKNTVQVGSSIINAMATNTRPISEGQFGAAPLYAFTDEGVWVLMTNSEGTYDARQPANREICSNPKGILQIDDAVLYPTERGIMMQEGRSSICITDQLEGYPFNFTQLYKPEYAKKVLAVQGIDEATVKYARLREFLKSADMIYDYYDSRIIVFNPSYQYAYVYSLKSKLWGTMENCFNKRVNIYPEAYATNKDGKILDVYVQEPTDSVPYFLCSRPLAISSNEIYKTMFSCITRGYFRNVNGKCGMVLYGSNDLFKWFPIKTSVSKYLRGMAGSPYKYFRIALVGSLNPDESISGMSADFQERWQNKLR